jgi:hypothetical protein
MRRIISAGAHNAQRFVLQAEGSHPKSGPRSTVDRFHVQRGDLISDPMRNPERSGLLLGEVVEGQGRRGTAVRLAERPVRRSWQVAPAILPALPGDHTSRKSQRVMEAMLKMEKLDIAKIERAYAG